MSLFSIFVQNPALIALISGLFWGAYMLLRSNSALRCLYLLVPATAWLLWAGWEWAIMLFSPEANIRVDLLAIFVIILLTSIYGLMMLFVKPAS